MDFKGDNSQPQMCTFTTTADFIHSRSRLYKVVFLKPCTCLNNFSITLKTFEGTLPSREEQRPWPWGQKRYTVGQADPLNAAVMFALRR